MFKKLTTFAILIALAVVFIVPAKSASRTIEKVKVKTEISTKIVKADIVTKVAIAPVNLSCTESTFNPLAISELNRPPGVKLAKANYARYNRYKNSVALNDKYKKQYWQSNKNQPPNLRRTV